MQQRGHVLAPGGRAPLDQVEDGGRGADVALAQAAAELRGRGRHYADAAATPLRSATSSTMSRMMRLRSKSFGV